MNEEVIVSRLDRLEDEVAKLRVKVVDGNGHDSLEVRMTKLEEAWKSQNSMLRWILWIVSGIAVTLLSAGIMAALKKLAAM